MSRFNDWMDSEPVMQVSSQKKDKCLIITYIYCNFENGIERYFWGSDETYKLSLPGLERGECISNIKLIAIYETDSQRDLLYGSGRGSVSAWVGWGGRWEEVPERVICTHGYHVEGFDKKQARLKGNHTKVKIKKK